MAIIRSGTTRDEWSMHLMRCLFFFVAKFYLTLWAEHLPGRCNGAADALSQDPSQIGRGPGAQTVRLDIQELDRAAQIVFLKVYSLVLPEHPEDGGEKT